MIKKRYINNHSRGSSEGERKLIVGFGASKNLNGQFLRNLIKYTVNQGAIKSKYYFS
jgi:hypothetical protein